MCALQLGVVVEITVEGGERKQVGYVWLRFGSFIVIDFV